MDLYEEAPFLYHYYELNTGPLINLSELDIDDAEKILKRVGNLCMTIFDFL